MEFRPLHEDFGVEVLGFDPQTGGSAPEVAALRRAYADHSLLLLRGCGHLSPERQLEIASWFGPPGPIANGPGGDLVTVLRNSDAAGRVALLFHSDLTYTDEPIHGICLHAIELPEGRTSTSFVSGAAAWSRLPADLTERLAPLKVRHRLDVFASGYDWPVFEAEHPIRFAHPRTGRPILFATEHHAVRIAGIEEAESRTILDDLFKRLYAPERRYEHVWQPGDLLMIDNLALQHARTEEADPERGSRALQRVALAEVGLQELVGRARARAAA